MEGSQVLVRVFVFVGQARKHKVSDLFFMALNFKRLCLKNTLPREKKRLKLTSALFEPIFIFVGDAMMQI